METRFPTFTTKYRFVRGIIASVMIQTEKHTATTSDHAPNDFLAHLTLRPH
jgi:hypothetical protein